jgi:hypothetical protein
VKEWLRKGPFTRTKKMLSRNIAQHQLETILLLPHYVALYIFLKKEVARGERTRVLSISFIFSFSPN